MKTMKKNVLILLASLALFPSLAQEKQNVSIADVWQDYIFYPRTVRGVNWTQDGRYYTSQNDKYIIKYDIRDGSEVDTLYGKAGAPAEYLEFDDYRLSPQENQILLVVDEQGIYRRSTKAFHYVYDMASKQMKAIAEGDRQSYATFSPDGSQVAWVRENNLYVTNLSDMKVKQLTTDGRVNEIIHGSADWVYEEEFSFAKAFFWSPDSKKIAYYTFDEREVKEYTMQLWLGPREDYPLNYKYKYPKAGETNSKITISVYDLEKNQSTKMDIGEETDIYIPRINWTLDPNVLSIRRMNRLQNQLDILHANIESGETKRILTEKSDTYVDLDFCDDLTYLSDGKRFLHSSEQDGYKHFYLYDMEGKLINQITQGDWEARELMGVDEKQKAIYYTSTEDSPLERQIYRIGLDGKKKVKLSQQKGTHSPDFSPDFKYYLDYFSAASTPTRVSIHEGKTGKEITVREDNQVLQDRLKNYKINYKEFFSLETQEGVKLNGWTIKPHDFDENKQYPLLMFVYGGPGSQQVTDAWDSFNFFWYQVLASKGYMIACVDNRGTGGRGAEFKKITYAQLGKYETQDQIAAAKYFAGLDYVDAERIGIWGWSYGGYMSSLCITKGAEVFKSAIAVAPVSTWRFYDTIYTERYLKKPQDNPEGYDDNSPIFHVDKLEGNYMLVHGTGDDNVHFQNAVELQNALIDAGKQFESFYYPNRAHSISGGNTRFHLYNMMTDFLERKL